MKRDPELLRQIMLDAEAHPGDEPIFGFEYEGKPNRLVLDHVKQLVEVGYLEGDIQTDGMGLPSSCVILRITSLGHDFLAKAQSPTVWNKTLGKFKSTGQAISLGMLVEVLGAVAKQELGISG